MTALDTLFGALELAGRTAIVLIVWHICHARRERDLHATRYLLCALGCQAIDLAYYAVLVLPTMLFPHEPLWRLPHNPPSVDDTTSVTFIRNLWSTYGPVKRCLDVAFWAFIAWAVLKQPGEAARQDLRSPASAPG